MPQWIRADRHFGDRARILVIPFLATFEGGLVNSFRALQEADADIEGTVAVIEQFIRIVRPDLADGFAWAIELDFAKKAWKVIYHHKSFSRIGSADTIPEMLITIDRKEHAHA